MWQYDFHNFYAGAQAVLAGLSPYRVTDFIGPFPLAILFIPFSLLPEQVAYWFFVILNLGLLLFLFRKKSVWMILSFPILFSLFVGQIDLLLALMVWLQVPWLLPLLLVKPQIAFIFAPYLLRTLNKKQWLQAIIGGIAFMGLCFILQPDWVQLWLANGPGMTDYAVRTSNIFWLVPAAQMSLRVGLNLAAAGLTLLLCIFRYPMREISWPALSLVQPLSNIYSSAVLVAWIGPLEMLLSWVAVILVGGDIHHGMPMFLVSASILVRQLMTQAQEQKVVTG